MTTRLMLIIGVMLTAFVASEPVQAQFSPQFNLIKAAGKNDVDEMQALLNKGVSADTRRRVDGYPVLLIATDKRYMKAATLLLENGGNPNIQSREREITALMGRAEADDTNMMRLLLDYKADINLRDLGGETALLKAVRARKSRAAKMLIEAGADPNFSDATGNTALSYAKQTRSSRMISMLEEAGAKD